MSYQACDDSGMKYKKRSTSFEVLLQESELRVLMLGSPTDPELVVPQVLIFKKLSIEPRVISSSL